MLILLYTPEPAPAAGTNWDQWTAIGTLILAAGTLALALVTLCTLLYTVRATNRDRKQAARDREDADSRLKQDRESADQRRKEDREAADQRLKEDREDADRRLKEERAAGDQRLKEEREHEADLRRRERQVDRASALVSRVAQLQACLHLLPGAAQRGEWGLNSPSPQSRAMVGVEALTALTSLRHGPGPRPPCWARAWTASRRPGATAPSCSLPTRRPSQRT